MIVIAVREEALNLGSKFRCLEEYYITSVCNLLKVLLAKSRVLPEISLQWKVHLQLLDSRGRWNHLIGVHRRSSKCLCLLLDFMQEQVLPSAVYNLRTKRSPNIVIFIIKLNLICNSFDRVLPIIS